MLETVTTMSVFAGGGFEVLRMPDEAIVGSMMRLPIPMWDFKHTFRAPKILPGFALAGAAVCNT